MKNKKKLLVFKLLLGAGLCAIFLPGNWTQGAAKGPSQVLTQASTDSLSAATDRIIISYKPNSQAYKTPAETGLMTSETLAAGVALQYFRSMSGDAHVLRLPGRLPLDQVQKIAKKLAALPDVDYAEPDQIRFPTLSPNDTLYSNQWDFFDSTGGINAQPAWNITTGSSTIVVAIGDTGLTNHVDLAGRMVSGAVATSGYDFINDTLVANDGNGRDSNPSDPGDWITNAESHSGYFAGCPSSNSSWHGTHVAGTIGAASNNSLGVAGINWNSKLLIVRVLGKCGGYDSDIIDGITWAAGLPVSGVPANANPAKVINLSLGGASASCPTSWQTAINTIKAAGAVIAVAAGNSSAEVSGFTPANCNGVIAVAATGKTGSLASYSNYGSLVKISAPGGSGTYGILSTLNTGTTVPVADTYASYQGTSMATPHVTGVISLMFSINPSLTPDNVLQILQGTARAFPGGSTCNTSICGSGIVDAGAAVSAAQPSGTFNKTSPANGATGQPTSLTLNWGSSARATSYSYCIDAIDNNVCDGSWVSVGNSVTASISALSPNTPYYWQVRASNGWVDAYADTNTWKSFTTIPNTFTLSVSITGTGTGTVSSTPAGINCGLTCSAFFNSTSSVSLNAIPNLGSTFTGWSGACTGSGSCNVTMDAAKAVSANFELESLVTVTIRDANHVPVDYESAYAYNEALDAWYGGTLNGNGQTVFTLPAGGYRFAAWVKGILYWSGSSNTCLIPGCTSDAVTLPTATVTVSVRDLNGVALASEAVYGYNASLDAWYAGTPNGSGQTVFELPVASYQFLAVVHGNYYMGSNTCTFPGCASYTVTVPALVTVTVKDANGVKLDNELVYAYNGVADAWVGGILNGSGQTEFLLPAGSYRFLAVVDGGYYWSGSSNTCTTPGCASDTVTVPAQVTVSVEDLNGTALDYQAVYAYNEAAGAWYAGTLNGNGQTVFALPVGSYQFLTLMEGNYYWGSTTCDLPGCSSHTATVPAKVTVTVQDANHVPVNYDVVYAYNGSLDAWYGGTRNGSGQTVFMLPAGSYRFLAMVNGIGTWSGPSDTCLIPGCSSDTVTIGP